MRRALPPVTAGVLAAVVLAAAGCGSETVHELPPAAEPARSPVPATTPAGEVLPAGPGAEGIAVDPVTHTIAVGVRAPAALILLRPGAATPRRVVALGSPPRHLAYDAATERFLVPTEGDDRLVQVTPAGAAQAAAVGAQPHDAAALAGSIFVGDERGNTVSVVVAGRTRRTFAVATQPGGLAAADGGHLLAVVSVRRRVLELYDPHTRRRVGSAGAGVGPTHVVAEADRLYVADTRGGALLVFGTRPRLALLRRVFLPGGPYGLAIDPVRHRLWVTLTARNEVVSLTADGRPREVRRLPTVRQPDSVAVDSALGTVVVAGRAAGVVQVIGAQQAYPQHGR
ncbi:YncE family protein [Baekduia soli]|uniref:YncE family protein n=1 Tax=Baekduia soli TaxID=496014 RepID=UPI001652714E|nr:YncE family protein [Baekduia soli]